jgi:uracil phosphoribosyltransferase
MATNASKDESVASTTSNGLLFGENVHVSVHPVISHKITQLRSSATNCGTFRNILKEVTYHLGYEATTKLTTKPVNINVPVGKDYQHHHDFVGRKLVEQVALIPILRSGLGMVDSMLQLLPSAQVHHIGMYKSAGALTRPVQYYNRLPRNCSSDVAFIMDVTIATSSTVLSVVNILKKVCAFIVLVCKFVMLLSWLKAMPYVSLTNYCFASFRCRRHLYDSGAFQKFTSWP